MASVPILETKNVCFNYQSGKPVLRDLNIAIPAGARVALVGPNGAGKSTLFLHFNAILRPTAGALYFQGSPYDYSRQSVNRLRQKIGLVFQDQDMQLFAPTVLDDVLFGPMNMGLTLAESERVARAAVETVEMTDYLADPVHFLSPGQKKRWRWPECWRWNRTCWSWMSRRRGSITPVASICAKSWTGCTKLARRW